MTRLRMAGMSANTLIFTLILQADGSAVLVDSSGTYLWTSDDEDSDDFNETFGDFIEEEHADKLADWLFENLPAIPYEAEIETRIEYDGDDEEETEEAEEGETAYDE